MTISAFLKSSFSRVIAFFLATHFVSFLFPYFEMSFRVHSNFAIELLKMFSDGDLTAKQVQTLALATIKDEWSQGCELTEKLARSGSSGVYSGNILRDVLSAARSVDLVASVCKPYVFFAGKNKHLVEMFLPHEILAHLSINNGGVEDLVMTEEQFSLSEGLGPLLRKWGDDVGFDGNLRECPVIGIHCDGVSYGASLRAGHQSSIISASLNVCSARELAFRHHRHPLFVVHKNHMCDCGCAGYDTYQEIHEVLSWSFSCLKEGLTPTHRHDGSEFTEFDKKNRMLKCFETPRCALLQVRGDWAQVMEAFRFRSVNSDTFCWMCLASKGLFKMKAVVSQNLPLSFDLSAHLCIIMHLFLLQE